MAEEAMDNLIWNDLWVTAHTVKVFELCCSKYADKMRKRKRIFDWYIILMPSLGALLYSIDEVITLIASILTAIGGLLEKIAPTLTQPESELAEIDNLQTSFSKILTELEDAIHSFRLEPNVSDIHLKGSLKKFKKQIDERKSLMGKLIRKSPNNDMLNNEASEYMKLKFTNNYASNE